MNEMLFSLNKVYSSVIKEEQEGTAIEITGYDYFENEQNLKLLMSFQIVKKDPCLQTANRTQDYISVPVPTSARNISFSSA